MSNDQQSTVAANISDDCSAEQPLKCDAAAACPVQPPKDEDAPAAACLVQSPNDDAAHTVPQPNDGAGMSSKDNDAGSPAPPPNDEMSVVVMSSKDDDAASPAPPPNDAAEISVVVMSKDDDAASPAPPPNDEAKMSVVMSPKNDDPASPAPPLKDDAGLAPPPNNDAAFSSPLNIGAGPSSPPEEVASPALPSVDDTAHPTDETIALVPKVEPELLNDNVSAATVDCDDSIQLKEEIKHETIDLGTDTYFYDDNNKAILVRGPPKVGFDRGLEPDHIVGATEVDGKLMFLIAWKNSEVADLLESTIIYDRCPQIAIQFFEARLKYCPNDNKE